MTEGFIARANRLFPAGPQRLFAVYTDQDEFRRAFQLPTAILDPRVNGLYFWEIVFDGRHNAHYGRYLEVEHARRLVHTFVSPGTGGKETKLTLTFAPAGTGAAVTITHEGLPDAENARAHEQGWKHQLDMLARHLEAK